MSHSPSCICSYASYLFQSFPNTSLPLKCFSAVGVFAENTSCPEASDSRVCHQTYQQSIQNELPGGTPGMVARGSINLVSWKRQAVGCARKGSYMLHLESSSESTFYFNSIQWGCYSWVVERALTLESGDLD